MCKFRKTTKAEFRKFKEVFRVWQQVLGVPEYEIYFEHRRIDAISQIERNIKGCTATVVFNNQIGQYDDVAGWVEATAKHEAIHLFLNRLIYLANSRWSAEREIDREEERIARILEKLI